MSTLTRKQRELAVREELILDTARSMLVERGYLGLTMDRLAEATEYSKGTLYQHFPNKEDLVASLAIQTGHKRADFFERAARYPGRPRERLAGIGEAAALFSALHPDHTQSDHILGLGSIREKISAEKRETLQAAELRCMEIAAGVVHDAVAAGDLELPEGRTPQEVVFGLWVMSVGCDTCLAMGKDLAAAGVTDPEASLWKIYNTYLDGLGWRPLSGEVDYAAVRARLCEEVFGEELARAHRLH